LAPFLPLTAWGVPLTRRDEEVKLDTEEIEELFATKAVKAIGGEGANRGEGEEDDAVGTGPRKKKVVILLSANRSQTIGVLLSHLKIPHEDFRRAIMGLDTRTLQPNFVVQLMKLLPTDQEVTIPLPFYVPGV